MARDDSRVTGWWIFAACDAPDRVGAQHHLGHRQRSATRTSSTTTSSSSFSSLKTWGWITLILGILQGFAVFSLASGGGFGRWFGLFTAILVAINCAASIPAYPLWSLCIFALSIIVAYELAAAPERGRVNASRPAIRGRAAG